MKGLKEKFSVFLALVLAVVMIAPVFTVHATEVPEFLTYGATRFVGDEVKVYVYLNSSSSVYGGNFTLQYDSDFLEVKEYSVGNNLSNHLKNCNLDYQSAGNLIRFTFSGASAVSADGYILTLTFTAKEKVGISEVTFVDYKMYGSDGGALACTATDTKVKIKGEPESLELDVPKNGTLELTNDFEVYEFTPDVDGTYVFSSQGDLDVMCSLSESEQCLDMGGSENTEGNFEYEVQLEKGKTYKLECFSRGSSCIGQFTVMVVKEDSTVVIDIGEDLKGWAGISSFTITPQITPEDAMEEITWDSSDTSIATVSAAGDVALVSGGIATITATTESGASDSIQVTSLAVKEVSLGTTQNVEFEDDLMDAYYKFTPTGTGIYDFTVENNIRAGFQVIGASSYYAGNSMEFSCQLTEGTTYNIWARKNVITDVGTYTFKIEKVEGIQSLEIVSLPTRMSYYEGCGSFDYDGLKVKAIMEDGTEAYWSYSTGPGDVNTLTDVSYGNVYENSKYVRTDINCKGVTVSFAFNVIENPVESIELFSGEMPICVENTNGYEYNGNFYYNISTSLYELNFKINYTDGSSEIVKVNDNINGYQVYWDNTQYDEPWTVGDNYIIVSYCGKEVNVPVQVVENTIESITLNTAPTYVYTFGSKEYGYISDEKYHLQPINLEGLAFTVKYKDGSYKTYQSTDLEKDEYGYYYLNGMDIQTDYIPVEAPGTYSVTIKYMGYDMEYEVEVQACSISSIEVVKAPTLSNYNEAYLADFAGMHVKINYTDGTSKTVEIQDSEIQYRFYAGQIPRLVRRIMVDGYLMAIEEEIDWMYQGYVSYYSIDYQGCTYLYRDITFEDDYKVESVEVLEMSIPDKKIVVKVTYLDGTTETIDKSLVWCDYGSDYYRLYLKTKYGISQVYIFEEYDDTGCLTAYSVYALGKNFEIPCEVKGLVIDCKPEKTTYNVGEDLNLSGLKLKIKYSDGSFKDVESGFLIGSFDSTTPGKKMVQITYGELSTSFVVDVVAEEIDGNSSKVTVTDVTANRGKQVKVDITLENNPGIASATIRVKYDSSVLTLIGIEDKGKLGATVHSDQFTNPYVLNWVNDTVTENFVYNGSVVTLIFEVAEDAAFGEYVVSAYYNYDNYDIYNVNAEKVKFYMEDGVITVGDTLIGDVNGDGVVNNLDRMVLTRYLANWENYSANDIDMGAADVNVDGTVNNLDRMVLTRYLANWNGYESLPYIN